MPVASICNKLQGYQSKRKRVEGCLQCHYFSSFVFASCGERLEAKVYRDRHRLRFPWLSRLKWVEFSNHEKYWITYLLYTRKFMNSTTQRNAAQRNHRNATQLLASYCELGLRAVLTCRLWFGSTIQGQHYSGPCYADE